MSKEFKLRSLTPSAVYEKTGCLKPCSYSHYSVQKMPYEKPSEVGLSNTTIHVRLFYNEPVIEHVEEFLQFDELELTGELGGFMGLFLGLSFYDILAKGLLWIQRKL